MLPFPGSPSSSWPMFNARLRAALAGTNIRVCVAFWFFGLINNVLYVIILSSALDLVGPSVPKSLVLLFDVIPSFLVKLCAPYFIHLVPYRLRVIFFAVLSSLGMLLIALTPSYLDGGTISSKMAGVILASLSSGGGELSFLGLTHFYGPGSLAAWGSGTGAAGLVGAGAYALATNVLELKVQTALLAAACLPVLMLLSFFVVLPSLSMRAAVKTGLTEWRLNAEHAQEPEQGEEEAADQHEEEGLLGSGRKGRDRDDKNGTWTAVFRANLGRSKKLFLPYMLPLLLVYVAEYSVNQGVAPTLLFPLPSTPFSHFRDFYPTYATIYQAGVFISRSSTPFFRVHNLYAPSLLQVLNLALLSAHAVWNFIPSVWAIFLVIFWEGLLGGLVYVNTFAEILDGVPPADREFSLGATSVSDSGGICIAGFAGMALEVTLCKWQVDHGRPFCKKL